MWYRLSRNLNNKAVFAQSYSNLQAGYFRQIDSEYYGYFNGSRLIDLLPIAIFGQPVDVSKITSFERKGDSIWFRQTINGRKFEVNVPVSVLINYLSINLKNNVAQRKSLQQINDEMKQEERLQASLYSEIKTLADDYLSKNYTKDSIKKNFQYKIFDLFQSGKISQQTGDYLYAWMVKYVDKEARPNAMQANKTMPSARKQQVYEGMDTQAIADEVLRNANEVLSKQSEQNAKAVRTPPAELMDAIKREKIRKEQEEKTRGKSNSQNKIKSNV